MAKLVIAGDARGAVKGIQDLNKALDQAGDEMKEGAKEGAKLERQAKRIAELADPMKKYNRQMAELAQHVKADRISMDDAKQMAARYQRQLQGLGNAKKKAFDPTLIAGFATRLVSVTAIMGGVARAFSDVEQRAQAAADSLFNSLGSFGELQQVSGGDPAKFAKHVAFARSLVSRGIVSPENKGQAADIAFALESAGYSDKEKELLATAAESKFVKPEGLTGFGGGLRKAQKIFGRAESGDLQAVMDKIIATSTATQSSASQVATAVTKFGSEASAIGLSDEEAYAAFAAIESVSPNVDEAATRTKNLFARMDKMGLGPGTSLAEKMSAIQGRIAGGKTETEVMPDIRGRTGFRNLRAEQSMYQEQLGLISSAGGTFERGSQLLSTDPRLRSAGARERAKGMLASAEEERFAEKENLFDAVLDEIRASKVSQYGGLASGAQTIMGMFTGLADLLGMENQFMRTAAAGGELSPALTRDVEDYLRRSAESLERIEGNGAVTARQE